MKSNGVSNYVILKEPQDLTHAESMSVTGDFLVSETITFKAHLTKCPVLWTELGWSLPAFVFSDSLFSTLPGMTIFFL